MAERHVMTATGAIYKTRIGELSKDPDWIDSNSVGLHQLARRELGGLN